MQLAAAIAGAVAYLPKEAGVDEILRTIHGAASGVSLMTEEEMQATLDELLDESNGHRELDRLTPQERRVFELVGQGLSNQEIADHLRLSERTVKNYVSRVLAKLDMSRRTEAAVLATRISERRAQRGAQEVG